MNKSLWLAGLTAISLTFSLFSAANAGNIKNGAPANLTVGGQVSRAILFVDDGKGTATRHVDNENDSTRFWFLGEAKLTPSLTMGSQFIGDVFSNQSNAVNASSDADTAVTFTERNLEIYLAHDNLGTLWLGQGETASDGISETDLSGTGIAGYSSIADVAGGFAFVNSATNTRSTVTIGDVADNLDGLDFADRVRWDSPELGGFQVRLGIQSSEALGAAVTYAGKFGETDFEASVGWYNNSANANTNDGFDHGFSGSASALMANGINVTVAAGTKGAATTGRDDPFFWYGKLGYIAKLNALGPTNIAVDFGQFQDNAQNGDTLDTIGVQVVQEFENAGASAFIAYRRHALDRTGADFDAINAVMTGAYFAF